MGRLIRARTEQELWSDAEVWDLSRYIVARSQQHDISPFLVLSLIEVESGFRPDAVSSRGAMGLMQLLPGTAAFVAQQSGLKWRGRAQLGDPKWNIDLGVRYFAQLSRQFPTQDQALTAYNIGPAALERKLKKGEKVSLEYYHRVKAAERFYRREALNPGAPTDRRKIKWL